MPQARNRGGSGTSGTSSLGCEVVKDAFLLIQGRHGGAVQTLGDRLLEDLLAGRDHVKEDRGTAGTLSSDSESVGVTPEVVDVALDPFQGLNLIQETDVVISDSLTGEVRVGEESESRQTIIDRDDNNFLALVDPGIIGQSGGVSKEIGPSVNIE